jgi:glutamyl/glutaminyl-tRNA synthetase
MAAQRAAAQRGTLILRNEDLDPQRSRAEFVRAMIEDLQWLGIRWSEGPDCGGPHAPYSQSERRTHYFEAWRRLRDGGFIYPCTCSRRDLAQAASAPNDDDEPIYPGRCRTRTDATQFGGPLGVNWRFRAPEGEQITFRDLNLGRQSYTAGRDFGDFLVWRRDDVPAYQLAVVVDDAAMKITEVVRGADLLKSTARQLLLIRSLGYDTPYYFHCDLVRDANGVRLAKRHDALSIRHLRETGATPEKVREMAYS